jgi:hypothetical protein
MRTPFGARFPKIRSSRVDLVTSTAGLSDDALELVDLGLGTAEGTELLCKLVLISWGDFGVRFDVLSSWRAYGHACPWSCGATQ